ncbi:MAG: alpha/beta hydrolase [Acidobacteriota bacterium]
MQTIPFVRGLAQLATDGTLGVTAVVEMMHRDIAGFGAAPELWQRTLTRFVYGLVRGGMSLSGKTLDVALGAAERWLTLPSNAAAETLLDDLACALNGAFGDHLEASRNPLAIAMQLRTLGGELQAERAALARAFPGAPRRLLLFVHGLCLDERCWSGTGGTHPAAALADRLRYACVFARYNTGRHVSVNGREMAVLLDRLVAEWPAPLEEISIVSHSMGGLVVRSACHYARQDGLGWTQRLRTAVYLGTPHHGAPFERLGQLATASLAWAPYTRALSLLGMARSAGVKDLRHGNLLDEDWQARDPDTSVGDHRRPVPLLPGVRHCMAAATLEQPGSTNTVSAMLGDMLVRVPSATGLCSDPARCLDVPPEQRRVFMGMGHFEMLRHPEVYAQVERWLLAEPGGA